MEKNNFMYTLHRMGVKSAPRYEGAFTEMVKLMIADSMASLTYKNNAFIAAIKKEV